MMKKSKKIKSISPTVWMALASLTLGSAHLMAAPMQNQAFQFKQPDGSKVPVVVNGDEYYQRVETPEGYTVIRGEDGWIRYATLNTDQSAFIAGEIYNPKTPLPPVYRTKHLDISPKAKEKLGQAAMSQLHKTPNHSHNSNEIMPAPTVSPPAAVSGAVKGLTIIVDFSDEPGTVPASDFSAFLNGQNYTGYGNYGSVREWYSRNSRGKLDYTNLVNATYYRASKPLSYYDDPNASYGSRPNELISEALNALSNSGAISMSQLTEVNGGVPLNIFYAGSPGQGWAKGMWPHQGNLTQNIYVGGKTFVRYQITNIGTELNLGTFVHENGHMLLGVPDLYPYESGVPNEWVTQFCIMGAGGTGSNIKKPIGFNPYFQMLGGWIAPPELNQITDAIINTSPSEMGDVKRFTNKNNSSEFYLLDARNQDGISANMPSQGLLIWHVSTDGSNAVVSNHPLISVVQADNNGSVFQASDYFVNRPGDVFNNISTPKSLWNDGSFSGLNLRNVSAYSTQMNYNLGQGGSILPAYTVTLHAADGTANVTPSSQVFSGSQVVLSAKPKNRLYMFTGWSGDESGIKNPDTVTVNKNLDITANFKLHGFQIYPKNKTSIAGFDSETFLVFGADTLDSRAQNLLDGDSTTQWETDFRPDAPNFPHFVTFKTNEEIEMAGFEYLPSYNTPGGVGGIPENGRVTSYQIYVSQDGINWGSPVAEGIWDRILELKTVIFNTPVKAQYLKFIALDDVTHGKTASGGEVDILYNTQATTIANNSQKSKTLATCKNGQLHILAPTAGAYFVRMMDVSGKSLSESTYNLPAGSSEIPLKMANAGVYLIEIKGENSQELIRTFVDAKAW